MKTYRLTLWLLLVAMPLLLAGVVQYVHERLDHPPHPPASVATHCDADHETPNPYPPSDRDDHDDCHLCFALLHTKASPLDLVGPVLPPQAVASAAILRPSRLATIESFGPPPGRGPPITPL